MTTLSTTLAFTLLQKRRMALSQVRSCHYQPESIIIFIVSPPSLSGKTPLRHGITRHYIEQSWIENKACCHEEVCLGEGCVTVGE